MTATNNLTIWSNENLKLEDWEDIFEDKEISEDAKWDAVYNALDCNLHLERAFLSEINLNENIIAIADIGRWNGRVNGYKEFESITDCLYSNCDYVTWYIDEEGEFCCRAVHHDGTNYYRYRIWKSETTDEQREQLKEKIYNNEDFSESEQLFTEPLGHIIIKAYGFKEVKKSAQN